MSDEQDAKYKIECNHFHEVVWPKGQTTAIVSTQDSVLKGCVVCLMISKERVVIFHYSTKPVSDKNASIKQEQYQYMAQATLDNIRSGRDNTEGMVNADGTLRDPHVWRLFLLLPDNILRYGVPHVRAIDWLKDELETLWLPVPAKVEKYRTSFEYGNTVVVEVHRDEENMPKVLLNGKQIKPQIPKFGD
jgi:hypothetical protein